MDDSKVDLSNISPKEDDSISNEFNKEFFPTQHQNTFRYPPLKQQQFYQLIKSGRTIIFTLTLCKAIQNYILKFGSPDRLFDQSVQRIQYSGVQSVRMSSPSVQSPQKITNQMKKLISTIKEFFVDMKSQSQKMEGLILQYLDGSTGYDYMRTSTLQQKFDIIMRQVQDCSNALINLVTHSQQMEEANQQLLEQRSSKQYNRLHQTIADLTEENQRLHQLLKNRESILGMSKKFDDSSTFVFEDEKLLALEKDKLSRKVSRLERRLEEESEEWQSRRKEWLSRERELVGEREQVRCLMEMKEVELCETRECKEELERQVQFLGEQMRLLQGSVEERRKQESSSNQVGDLVRSLRQQVRQLGEEKRQLSSRVQEVESEREERESELEGQVQGLETKLRQRQEQVNRVSGEKERLMEEKQQLQQQIYELRGDTTRKSERELVECRKQVENGRRVIRELQNELKEMEQSVVLMQRNLDVKDDQLIGLTQDCQMASQSIQQLQDSLRAHKEQLFRVQVSCKQQEQRIQEKDIQLSILRKEGEEQMQELQQLQDNYRMQVNELSERLNESGQQLYQAEVQLKAFLNEQRQLNEKLELMHLDAIKQESLNKLLQAEMQDKDSLIAQLHTRLVNKDTETKDQFNKIKDKLIQQIQDKESLEAQLEEAKLKFNSQLQSSITINDQLTQQLTQLKQQQEKQQLQDQKSYKTLQAKCKLQETQILNLSQQLTQLSIQQPIQPSNNHLDQDYSLINEELQSLKLLNDKLQQDIKTKDKKISSQESQLKQSNHLQSDQEKEINTLQNKLKELNYSTQDQLTKLQTHNHHESTQFKELEITYQLLKTEFDTLHYQNEQQTKEYDKKVKELKSQLQSKEEKSQLVYRQYEELQKKWNELSHQLQQESTKNQQELTNYNNNLINLKDKTTNATHLLRDIMKQKHIEANSLNMVAQLLTQLQTLIEDMTNKWVEQITKPGSIVASGNTSFEQYT